MIGFHFQKYFLPFANNQKGREWENIYLGQSKEKQEYWLERAVFRRGKWGEENICGRPRVGKLERKTPGQYCYFHLGGGVGGAV